MARTGRARGAVALVAGVLVVAACGGGGSKSNDALFDLSDEPTTTEATTTTEKATTTTEKATTTSAEDTTTTSVEESTTTAPPEQETTTTEQGDKPVPDFPVNVDDIVMRVTLQDLNNWWNSVFPDVYPQWLYSPPTEGAFSLHPGDTVQCGSVLVRYSDVEDNAIYAPCDDTHDGIFIDTEKFIPELVTNSGQFAGALIAAHEYGHLIQHRGAEANNVSQTLELQADCYAGAWARHVADDGVPFDLTTRDLDVALSALIGIGDPPGLSSDTPGLHGSAFDRVSAFTQGLKDVQNCVTFQTDPPLIFEMPFSTPEEQGNGGNLDVDTLIQLVDPDLQKFLTTEVDASWPIPPADAIDTSGQCDGRDVELEYCPSTNQVVVNYARLRDLHNFLGDWSTATLLVRAYGDYAGVSRGVSNCLAGAFDRALYLDVNADPHVYQLQLSSGDLDESARVFLIKSQSGDGIISVDQLRTGLLNGVDACQQFAN